MKRNYVVNARFHPLMRLTAVLVFMGAAIFAQSRLPQPTHSANDLPTPKEVLQKYVSALGGKDLVLKPKSITTRGKIEIPTAGITAEHVIYAKPNKRLTKTTVPGTGVFLSGFDGEVAWDIDPRTGARLKKIIQIESMRREADIYYPLHVLDYFRSMETVSITDFEGRPCYHLRGITNWGKENNQFYDQQTGLLAGYRFMSDSPAGAEMVTQIFGDYKNFGGPLVPTRMVVKQGQETRILTYTSITYDDVDEAILTLPDEVKALVNASSPR